MTRRLYPAPKKPQQHEQSPDEFPVIERYGGSEVSDDEAEDTDDDDDTGAFDALFLNPAPLQKPLPQRCRPTYDTPAPTTETKERIERLKHLADEVDRKSSQLFTPPQFGELEEKYFSRLNRGQFAAATLTEGPLLVIAGAGSGKTRTLTHRAAYLIDAGVAPEKILLVTFTRRAAEEMTRRAQELTGKGGNAAIASGTFHSIAHWLLRKYAALAAIPPDFTIIDQVDAEDIVDLIRRELKFEKKDKKFPRKDAVYEMISRSRNTGRALAELIAAEQSKYEAFTKDIVLIAEQYRKYKAVHRVMDYDDLLEALVNALKNFPEFNRAVTKRFSHIMVDEYQDTNIIQRQIVELLAAPHRNVMVVGDDSQSIYAFRGANFENIFLFAETFPDCRVIKLEQNYRSSQEILDLANAVIDEAAIGCRKRLTAVNGSGLKPLIRRCADAEHEAAWIVSQIRHTAAHIAPGEIAVLYRSSFHGTYIQAELIRAGIHYAVYGGIKFIERRHIKDIIAYMRIAQNLLDAVSWNRLLTTLPGVGSATAGQIIAAIRTTGSLDISSFKQKKYYADLEGLAKIIGFIRSEALTPAHKLDAARAHYGPLLRTIDADWEERLRDVEVLIDIAQRYDSLDRFLADFTLDPPSNTLGRTNRPMLEDTDKPPVILSTIHSAKGLEWHTVFVPHLLDGYFPTDKSLKSLEDIEEERRLFYVACSRARERLILTYPAWAAFWKGLLTLPSRFIHTLPESEYEFESE